MKREQEKEGKKKGVGTEFLDFLVVLFRGDEPHVITGGRKFRGCLQD